MVLDSKESYVKHLCDSLEGMGPNNNSYWHLIKKLLGNKFSYCIPTLEHNDLVASTNTEKAAMFLRKFTRSFKHNNDESYLPNCPPKTRILLNDININRDTVLKLLKDLNVSKSGGNDKITNKMMKMAADSLATPLYLLLSKILAEGVVPDTWKLGTLVPIYKNKGSRNNASNYRPVTLLNTIPKILERIIYNSIISHVTINNLLFVNQSGFLHGHDTQKQLIQITHMLKSNINNGMETRGIFLDIEGAFDAIPHFLLIHKLKSFGWEYHNSLNHTFIIDN
jgi:hypothetical protein